MSNAGRPPFFETKEELDKKIQEYFDDCDRYDQPFTITGLALHLGFCSRQSLYDYEKKEEFSYSIKRAKAMVENAYEKALSTSPSATGAIFALKNFGWKDKQEHDHTTNGKDITPPISWITPDK